MSQSKRKPRNVQVVNRCKYLQYQVNKVRSLFHFFDRQIRPDKIADGELSVAFMNNEEIQQLHLKFFNDASTTDVITFEEDLAMDFAGEICVCVDVAQESAIERDLTLTQEISLYLIHGWLHLAGYDDKSEGDRKSMGDAEKRLISAATQANKIPLFTLL